MDPLDASSDQASAALKLLVLRRALVGHLLLANNLTKKWKHFFAGTIRRLRTGQHHLGDNLCPEFLLLTAQSVLPHIQIELSSASAGGRLPASRFCLASCNVRTARIYWRVGC